MKITHFSTTFWAYIDKIVKLGTFKKESQPTGASWLSAAPENPAAVEIRLDLFALTTMATMAAAAETATGSSAAALGATAHVLARFSTPVSSLPSVDPAPIRVPTSLDPAGLSTLVNRLIGARSDRHRAFAFLVEGALLNCTLAEHLAQRGLSLESLLSIEYLVGLPPPTPLASFLADDWFSAVAASSSRRFVSAGFDGVVRVWPVVKPDSADANSKSSVPVLKEAASFQLGRAALKAVTVVPFSDVSRLRVLTGGLDRQVSLLEFTPDDSLCAPAALHFFEGHSGSVESIAMLGATRFATASYDSMVRVYAMPSSSQLNLASGASKSAEINAKGKMTLAGKRKRDAAASSKNSTTAAPLMELSGHKGPVSTVVVGAASADASAMGGGAADESTSYMLLSGGHDATVRQWDTSTASQICSIGVDTCVNAAAISSASRMLATVHVDCALRLHDLRSKVATVARLNTGHEQPPAAVAWRPGSANHVATAGFDGYVRVFDVRSTGAPLHVLAGPASGKQRSSRRYCVAWDAEGTLVSGGQDCKLNLWSFL